MSELMEAAKRATLEELAEFAEMLEVAKRKAAAAKIPVTQQPCMRNPADLNKYGMELTAEEKWDRDHPLIRKPYGFRERKQIFGHDPQVKVWSQAEVDAYNKPIEEEWLAEKRKLFPDAQLPPNSDTGYRPSKFGKTTRRG